MAEKYEPQVKKFNFEEVSFLDTGTNTAPRLPAIDVIDMPLLCKQ